MGDVRRSIVIPVIDKASMKTDKMIAMFSLPVRTMIIPADTLSKLDAYRITAATDCFRPRFINL